MTWVLGLDYEVPDDSGSAIQYLPEDDVVSLPGTGAPPRLARRHTFFRTGRHGRPIQGTAVDLYVPASAKGVWLLEDGQPTPECLRMVAEHMGWA